MESTVAPVPPDAPSDELFVRLRQAETRLRMRNLDVSELRRALHQICLAILSADSFGGLRAQAREIIRLHGLEGR